MIAWPIHGNQGVSLVYHQVAGAKACLDAARVAYDAAGVSDRVHHVIGGAGHRFYADDTWPTLHGEIAKL